MHSTHISNQTHFCVVFFFSFIFLVTECIRRSVFALVSIFISCFLRIKYYTFRYCTHIDSSWSLQCKQQKYKISLWLHRFDWRFKFLNAHTFPIISIWLTEWGGGQLNSEQFSSRASRWEKEKNKKKTTKKTETNRSIWVQSNNGS